jgi:hypothetical protein
MKTPAFLGFSRGYRTSDTLGCRSHQLVPDPLGGDLTLELREAEQHIEREAAIEVVVSNDCVIETKLISALSKASTSVAKSRSEQVSRSAGLTRCRPRGSAQVRQLA